MPTTTTAITATVQQVMTVKLKPTTRQMVLARCEENARLSTQIKALEVRQKRLKQEVHELFVKDGQGKPLLDGVDIDGHKVTLICASRDVLNRATLIELGCEPSWIAEATDHVPNEPYLKITAPKPIKDDPS